MKLLLSALLAGSAFAIVTPALAASEADYRAYCQDEDYYARNEQFCSRFDREDDSDRSGSGFNTSYEDRYDSTADSGHRVRNSNYNYNRTYLPGQTSRPSHRTDSSYNDRNEPYGTDAPRDPAQDGTRWYDPGNDSNSYTGQRSTTH